MADKKKSKEIRKSKSVPQVAAIKRSNTLLPWVCVAIIALITYFVFSPSLQNDFTNWDDEFYVTASPMVISDHIQLDKILVTPVASNYHPLTILSLALNYQSSKLDPFNYHLENVIFHVLNTILVFFFIFLLTRRNLLMAAIVSLFFGIHPMHVESVSWISERKDVLYVFFFLAGIITYLRYSESKKISWYIFTLLLFVFSCLSKAMAVVFPVILLLIDYLKNAKWTKQLVLEKIPFLLLSLLIGIIAIKAQVGTAIDSMTTFSFFQRLLFVSYGAVMYIVMLFLPVKLSAFYPNPFANAGGNISPMFYISPFILLLIIGAVIYFFRKKQKKIVFGLLFYFVSVALVLQFIKVGMAIMADRYSYLSYIGLLFVVAYVVNKAWQNKNNLWPLFKYPFTIFVIIGAVIFSYKAYSRTQVWKNSETLWTDVIDNYPNAFIAYKSLGDYYYDNHEIEKALNDYNKAIELDSNYVGGYSNRAQLYFNTGKTDLALADCNKAIALNSNSAGCYYNRGFIYSTIIDKKDAAIADYTKAITLDSNYEMAWLNRGLLYSGNGKYDLAIADFTKAIRIDPDYAEAYVDRGIAHFNNGEKDLAIMDFSKAININPSVPGYWFNRSIAEKQMGKYENAKADALKAQQLQGK